MRKYGLGVVLAVLIAVLGSVVAQEAAPKYQDQLETIAKSEISERAQKLVDELKEDSENVSTWYNLACYLALDGNTEEALLAWETAVAAGWEDAGHAGKDPDLETLREMDRFKAGLKKAEETRVANNLRRERENAYFLKMDETLSEGEQLFRILAKANPEKTEESAASIGGLGVFNGQIYIGYGDGNKNLGPISLTSYDPKSGKLFDHFQLQEHMVNRFNVVDAEMIIPGTEPYEGLWGERYLDNYDLGNVYRVKSDGRYVKLRTVPMGLHVLDATRQGDLVFAAYGTATEDWRSAWGQISISRDGGQSWGDHFKLPYEAKPGDVARANHLREFNGEMYGFGYVFSAEGIKSDPFGESDCFVYREGTWTPINLYTEPGLQRVYNSTVIGETLVLSCLVDGAGVLVGYDGESGRSLFAPEHAAAFSIANEGDILYVVVGNKETKRQAVYRTTDLKDFTQMFLLPADVTFTSMAVLDGVIYLGTEDGRLVSVE